MALISGSRQFTCLVARFSIHLPFTPVPITGQTLAVLLTTAAFGGWPGPAGAVLKYLTGIRNSWLVTVNTLRGNACVVMEELWRFFCETTTFPRC